jgi:hypothetical protein
MMLYTSLSFSRGARSSYGRSFSRLPASSRGGVLLGPRRFASVSLSARLGCCGSCLPFCLCRCLTSKRAAMAAVRAFHFCSEGSFFCITISTLFSFLHIISILCRGPWSLPVHTILHTYQNVHSFELDAASFAPCSCRCILVRELGLCGFGLLLGICGGWQYGEGFERERDAQPSPPPKHGNAELICPQDNHGESYAENH